jgi:hypothetical protein
MRAVREATDESKVASSRDSSSDLPLTSSSVPERRSAHPSVRGLAPPVLGGLTTLELAITGADSWTQDTTIRSWSGGNNEPTTFSNRQPARREPATPFGLSGRLRSKGATMIPRMQRLLAVSGLIFVALVAASIFILPNAPDSHASASTAVAYFHAHKTATGVAAHLIVLAIFVGLFFFWYFRNLIAATPATKHLATVGFAGALLFAVSGAVAAASYYTLGDAIGHVGPSSIQTLNLFQADFPDGVGEAGVAVFLVASSVAIIRGEGRLPNWVGWLGIVLGIASLLVIGLGVPALGLWLVVTCIVMLVRTSSPSAPTASDQELALA